MLYVIFRLIVCPCISTLNVEHRIPCYNLTGLLRIPDQWDVQTQLPTPQLHKALLLSLHHMILRKLVCLIIWKRLQANTAVSQSPNNVAAQTSNVNDNSQDHVVYFENTYSSVAQSALQQWWYDFWLWGRQIHFPHFGPIQQPPSYQFRVKQNCRWQLSHDGTLRRWRHCQMFLWEINNSAIKFYCQIHCTALIFW